MSVIDRIRALEPCPWCGMQANHGQHGYDELLVQDLADENEDMSLSEVRAWVRQMLIDQCQNERERLRGLAEAAA